MDGNLTAAENVDTTDEGYFNHLLDEKDKSIQLLAGKLLEAAADIRDWGKAFNPRAIANKNMMRCCDEYRGLANQFINKEE